MSEDIEICDMQVIHEDVVNSVIEQLPSDKRIEELANFYKIFSDPTKIKILWALDISEMCGCDLAAITGVTKSAISHQLSSLKELNLVKARKQGKIVYYSLSDNCVKEILEKGDVVVLSGGAKTFSSGMTKKVIGGILRID